MYGFLCFVSGFDTWYLDPGNSKSKNFNNYLKSTERPVFNTLFLKVLIDQADISLDLAD